MSTATDRVRTTYKHEHEADDGEDAADDEEQVDPGKPAHHQQDHSKNEHCYLRVGGQVASCPRGYLDHPKVKR